MAIYPKSEITGAILAGGRGSRMGGADKGLAMLAGRPLVEHVMDAVAPQVGTLVISANRNLARYLEYGRPVVADSFGGFQGPLAGLSAVLAQAATPGVLVVPCDSPHPPADLAKRLGRALCIHGADVAVAHDGHRLHPVFCLVRTAMRTSLEDYLKNGGRKIDPWFGRVNTAVCDFSDQAQAFENVNTPEQLERAGRASARTARAGES